jgi:oligo-1,6-glucosidase
MADCERLLEAMHSRGIRPVMDMVLNLISKVPGFPDSQPPAGRPSDPFPYVADRPRIHEFLKEMRREAFAPYGAIAVGETPGVSVESARRYTDPSESELDMIFQFEMVDLDSGPGGKFDLRPTDPEAMESVMRRWQYGLADKGRNSLYWSNHDQPRTISRYGDPTSEREISGRKGSGAPRRRGRHRVRAGGRGRRTGLMSARLSSILDGDP